VRRLLLMSMSLVRFVDLDDLACGRAKLLVWTKATCLIILCALCGVCEVLALETAA
jgi:hypothetical protein